MQIEVIIEKKSHKLDAEEGKTILETLQEHGIHVLTAPCGGRGRCGKCTVEVEHMGEVLACMTKVTDGMRITIPEVQLRAQKSKIAENGTVTHYPADDGEGLDAACDIGTTTVVLFPLNVNPHQKNGACPFTSLLFLRYCMWKNQHTFVAMTSSTPSSCLARSTAAALRAASLEACCFRFSARTFLAEGTGRTW